MVLLLGYGAFDYLHKEGSGCFPIAILLIIGVFIYCLTQEAFFVFLIMILVCVIIYAIIKWFIN